MRMLLDVVGSHYCFRQLEGWEMRAHRWQPYGEANLADLLLGPHRIDGLTEGSSLRLI